ncbi:MAG: NifU family protein [bacterium]|nr:NifU family protein [bacterium]
MDKPPATTINGDAIRSAVTAILDEVRPSLAAHEGDARLVEVDGEGNVTLELVGSCKGCPMSVMTFGLGVEKMIRERCPEVQNVFYT